jgi:DNA processing protein
LPQAFTGFQGRKPDMRSLDRQSGSDCANAAWLALVRTPGLGPRRTAALLARFGDPETVLNAGQAQLKSCGLPSPVLDALQNPDWAGIDRDLRWLDDANGHLLHLGHPEYPSQLLEIADPPPALFVLGRLELLSAPQLAIVGSRNPTASGRQTAYEFARHLGTCGLVIASGLALGIDAAGHQGALDSGAGTVAVAGTGLDRVYPARNRELAHRIAEQGALVSEHPLGTPPRAEHFPRRNRIISGLSLGTLVVEAGLRSGSLHTAQQALEQGREVFAIPGSIHNPLARGCHALLRQGAKLVEEANDIIEELGPLNGSLRPSIRPPRSEAADAGKDELDGEYRALLDSIGFEPTPLELVMQRCGLTPEAISSMLLLLELKGYVSSAPGGCYCRVPPSLDASEAN